MAGILIATVPGAGHVNPMLTVARELVAAGHTVHWYTGRVFSPAIEAAGCHWEPMRAAFDHGGVPVEDAFPRLRGLAGRRYFVEAWKEIFIGAAPAQLQDLRAVLDRFPADVLLCDETHFGMGLTRETTGLPLVWLSTSVYFFRSRDTAPIGLGLPPNATWYGRLRNAALHLMADHVLLRELRTAADRMRAGAGLPRLPGGALQNITRPPDLYLMGTVPAFEYPRSDLRPGTRFVGPFVAPADAGFEPPAWWPDLAGDRPVVHVTEGTVNVGRQRLLRPAIEAMADHDVLVVAGTGGVPADALDLGPLPDNVRVEPFIPHAHLLPHVDVMVTNGGYGGVQMALANGVPLVVAGATEEKPEVAAHVAYAGVGIDLRTLEPTPRQLAGAIGTVLSDPAYRRHARELQREYTAHNGPRTAARLITGLLAERRIPR